MALEPKSMEALKQLLREQEETEQEAENIKKELLSIKKEQLRLAQSREERARRAQELKEAQTEKERQAKNNGAGVWLAVLGGVFAVGVWFAMWLSIIFTFY